MTTVNDDNVGDFTNDLASDIGPLLALFGENMTIQYLSESTSFLDYFIFAMAPIGIITAIVSTIRLCGHASFRAFIGRSQEGEGAIEAELCTSTSRDVCELFTKGGVQRVLGRPSILELVYVECDSEEKTQNSDHAKEEAGLYLSRNYFEDRVASENPHWKKVRGASLKSLNGKANRGAAFAPNPNLSLNVGVRKQPPWVFWAIAAIGLVLQIGVVVLAGVGVWILDWNLNEAEGSAKDYAPSMYITGTLLLCGGMWSCAALIGQTTDEIRFKRRGQDSSQRSRILWLQPGPQVIGDQSFDPYAYFEDAKKDPLRVWTSSSKNFPDIFELYTFFAIFATLVGYIIQFIGLRGMKGWVSLAQLGITVVMSLLRGLLRIKRLGRNDNELATMPDMVAGHELDWLASKLVSQNLHKEFFWHITGRYENAREPIGHSRDLTDASSPERSSSTPADGSGKIASTSTADVTDSSSRVMPVADTSAQAQGDHSFHIRVRLAHLTGNNSFKRLDDSEYQNWEDEYVKVRSKARDVATAICTAAARLSKDHQDKDLTLRIEAASLAKDQATCQTQLIDIDLRPPPAFSTAGWRMDSAQLEAALGLWLWVMISDERLLEDDNDRASRSMAEKIHQARIIAAGMDDECWDADVNMQSEMNLWLGSSAVNFRETTLTFYDKSSCGLATLFKKPKSNSSPGFVAHELGEDIKLHTETQRFCGWSHVHSGPEIETGRTSRSSATSGPRSEKSGAGTKLRIQFSDLALTDTSLLDLCAQELFAVLMCSLAGVMPLSKTALSENSGRIRLENESVNIFVNAFQEAGLGSSSDAMLCVIPALRQKLEPLHSDRLLSALCKSADNYRQESEWKRAETVLQWACKHFAQNVEESGKHQPSPHFVRALHALAELYRWSLAHSVWKQDDGSAPSRRAFGVTGIDKMADSYGDTHRDDPEIQAILNRYQDIAQSFREQRNNNAKPDSASLKASLLDQNRTEALYQLCFINPHVVSSGDPAFRSALPLAIRNDWGEVVNPLLEMKANPNSTHVDKSTYPHDERTALSYCVELGFESYIVPLLEHGSAIDEPAGRKSQAPISYAAKNGHLGIVQLLFKSGHIDIDRKDNNGKTCLTHAAEEGHVAVVEELVQNGAHIEVEDDLSWTPLMWASFKGHKAVVQRLLQKGAKRDVKDKKKGHTAHMLAARMGHADVVEAFLNSGTDIESKSEDHSTALAIAAISGKKSVVQLLLDRGADIESRDEYENTPLMRAIECRHWAVVQLLVGRGANVEHENKLGHTTLIQAVEVGDERMVELLLDKGADIERKDPKFKFAPLVWAIREGCEEVVQLLVKRGANLEEKDKYDRTVLIWAVNFGRNEVVPLLLERDVNIESKDEVGATPLISAAFRGYTDIARMLVEKGARLEEKEMLGRTALCVAAEGGHKDCVRLLADKGARLEEKDNQGRTALHLAAEKGHKDCVELLVEKGAIVDTVDNLGKSPAENIARLLNTRKDEAPEWSLA